MTNTWKKCCAAVMATALGLGGAATAAEIKEPSPLVRQQMASIAAEKSSRTPAQQKIDSGLLMAIKLQRRDPTIQDVPLGGARMDLVRQRSTTVEIGAVVTRDLQRVIRKLGGRVIANHPQFDSVRAEMPLQAGRLRNRPA